MCKLSRLNLQQDRPVSKEISCEAADFYTQLLHGALEGFLQVDDQVVERFQGVFESLCQSVATVDGSHSRTKLLVLQRYDYVPESDSIQSCMVPQWSSSDQLLTYKQTFATFLSRWLMRWSSFRMPWSVGNPWNAQSSMTNLMLHSTQEYGMARRFTWRMILRQRLRRSVKCRLSNCRDVGRHTTMLLCIFALMLLLELLGSNQEFYAYSLRTNIHQI